MRNTSLVVLFILAFEAIASDDDGYEESPLDEDLYNSWNSLERRDNNLPYVVESPPPTTQPQLQQPGTDLNQLAKTLQLDCSAKCNNHLFATLRSTLEGSTTLIFQNFREMCRNYEYTMRCMNEIHHCTTNKMYNSLTSGLRYMCIDQKAAIEQLLPCVNEVFPSIQPACERSCQTDRMATGLTMKQLFQEDIKLLKIVDQHIGRLTANEACRVSQCMLKCYRTRLNVRCDGAAGSILTEGLIRPYAEIHEVGSIFMALIATVIPRQCTFLTDPKEMAELRIDPVFDRHIHNKYAELTKVDNTRAPQEPYVDPFQNLSIQAEASPLDNE